MQVPFPLEIVVEVLHKMNRIKKKKHADILTDPKLSTRDFGKETDIGSVAILDWQFGLETDVVESKDNLFEVSKQG